MTRIIFDRSHEQDEALGYEYCGIYVSPEPYISRTFRGEIVGVPGETCVNYEVRFRNEPYARYITADYSEAVSLAEKWLKSHD